MTAMSGLKTFEPLTGSAVDRQRAARAAGAFGAGGRRADLAGSGAGGRRRGAFPAAASFASSAVRRSPYCCFSASKSFRS